MQQIRNWQRCDLAIAHAGVVLWPALGASEEGSRRIDQGAAIVTCFKAGKDVTGRKLRTSFSGFG